jgi:hypothetical protein
VPDSPPTLIPPPSDPIFTLSGSTPTLCLATGCSGWLPEVDLCLPDKSEHVDLYLPISAESGSLRPQLPITAGPFRRRFRGSHHTKQLPRCGGPLHRALHVQYTITAPRTRYQWSALVWPTNRHHDITLIHSNTTTLTTALPCLFCLHCVALIFNSFQALLIFLPDSFLCHNAFLIPYTCKRGIEGTGLLLLAARVLVVQAPLPSNARDHEI